MHLSNEARAYKASIAQLRGIAVHVGSVRITLDWYRSRRAGDLDKRIGVCLDALQGVLFDNDSQIVELRATRHDDPTNPRIEVCVEPAGGP